MTAVPVRRPALKILKMGLEPGQYGLFGGPLGPVNDREMRRGPPVRHRDAGVGRRADGAGDAGHDLERHTGRRQRLCLLAAPPEHERVAALEPDHLAAGAGVGDDALCDRFLTELVGTGELAGVDEPDAWA